MKEHLKDYFPDRFENSINVFNIQNKIADYVGLVRPSKMQCQAKVADILERSDQLKLLTGAMKKFGCNFNLQRHVSCETCFKCYGGYDPDTNQIVICENQRLTNNQILGILMHEMVHMFDFCRFKFDYDNIEHISCSEIRAANLSTCTLADKLYRGFELFKLRGAHRDCVKRTAFSSVKAYAPDKSDEEIKDVLDKVFPFCYNDLEPFGRRPTNGMKELKHSYRERYLYGYLY